MVIPNSFQPRSWFLLICLLQIDNKAICFALAYRQHLSLVWFVYDQTVCFYKWAQNRDPESAVWAIIQFVIWMPEEHSMCKMKEYGFLPEHAGRLFFIRVEAVQLPPSSGDTILCQVRPQVIFVCLCVFLPLLLSFSSLKSSWQAWFCFFLLGSPKGKSFKASCAFGNESIYENENIYANDS